MTNITSVPVDNGRFEFEEFDPFQKCHIEMTADIRTNVFCS